jgi:DNA-binding response OmpR family regulator
MRILVVEDDRKVASFIRKGLEEEGHAVEVAGDGKLALASRSPAGAVPHSRRAGGSPSVT